MEKAKLINFEIQFSIDWECPHCKNQQTTTYTPSPYRAIAEYLPEEQCEKCKEFVELTLFEDDEEEIP
jgi:phage FluMu protein Com